MPFTKLIHQPYQPPALMRRKRNEPVVDDTVPIAEPVVTGTREDIKKKCFGAGSSGQQAMLLKKAQPELYAELRAEWITETSPRTKR